MENNINKVKVSTQYNETERPLQSIHSSLCEPMLTIRLDGNKGFISFIDDFTRFPSLCSPKEEASNLS